MKVAILVAVALVLAVGVNSTKEDESVDPQLFADVISVCKQRQEQMSQHPFFKMLADQSIPVRQRMMFAPYWASFALSAADVMDTWLYFPNPRTELEELVDAFIGEDNFHYNFFLHDLEEVFGYTMDRFGSVSAVMRHMYGADSKAVRELMYAWVGVVTKYSNDPIVILASFEAGEACMKTFFETVYTYVFLAEEELKDMQYFGTKHVELEMNHKLTTWFKGDDLIRPLAQIEITPLQKEHALEAVEVTYEKYVPYLQLHAMSMGLTLHFTCPFSVQVLPHVRCHA